MGASRIEPWWCSFAVKPWCTFGETHWCTYGRKLTGLVPPNGRGGPLHRHVQQLVAAEATSKGYRAEIEVALPSGDAVDIHLSRASERIAVEIWVGSRLSRELAHVENCLAAGYDRILCLVFAETLEAELRRAIPQHFPDQADRVRVIPLKQVGHLW